MSLATGEIEATAMLTAQDDPMSQLILRIIRSSSETVGDEHFGPHVEFEGDMEVASASGRFSGARGTLRFDGWSRPLNPETGEGIGFYTLTGTLYGTDVKAQEPWYFGDSGGAEVVLATNQFTSTTTGIASPFGPFEASVAAIEGPQSNQVLGNFGGKFTQSFLFTKTYVDAHGDELQTVGFELVFFAIGADGAPDLTVPSPADIYYRVTGGTGKFTDVQGVAFSKGVFTTTQIADGVLTNTVQSTATGHMGPVELLHANGN